MSITGYQVEVFVSQSQHPVKTGIDGHGHRATTLDARAVPAATVVGGAGGGWDGVAANPVDAQDGADEEDEGAEEVEGDVGLPDGARVAVVDPDVVPVKDVAAKVWCQ